MKAGFTSMSVRRLVPVAMSTVPSRSPSFATQHHAARRQSKRSGYLVFASSEQHGAPVAVGVGLHP